jgi:hypothetical protein
MKKLATVFGQDRNFKNLVMFNKLSELETSLPLGME